MDGSPCAPSLMMKITPASLSLALARASRYSSPKNCGSALLQTSIGSCNARQFCATFRLSFPDGKCFSAFGELAYSAVPLTNQGAPMPEAFQFVALFSCALFAGAALYINLAEHPACMQCGTELAATVFGPSYHRATMMSLKWRHKHMFTL